MQIHRQDRRPSVELRQVLFWALAAAQCAGETQVSRNRLIIALLRSQSIADHFEPSHTAPGELIAAIEDPARIPFDECVLRDASAGSSRMSSSSRSRGVTTADSRRSSLTVCTRDRIAGSGGRGFTPARCCFDPTSTPLCSRSLMIRLAAHGFGLKEI